MTRLSGEGWRWLKVYSHLDARVFDAVADAAEAHGIRFLGHVPFTVPLQHALDRRMLSIEHLTGYELALGGSGATPTERWASMSVEEMPSVAAATAAAGTWNCPTITVVRALLQGPETMEASRRRRELVGALHAAGARLLAGTDSGIDVTVPGLSLHDELLELVASGLGPLEALRAATTAPAEFLGEVGGDWDRLTGSPRGSRHGGRRPAGRRRGAPSPAGGDAPGRMARAPLSDRHSRTGVPSAARFPLGAPGASRSMARAPAAAMAITIRTWRGSEPPSRFTSAMARLPPEHPAGVDGAGDGAALLPPDPGLGRDDAGARRGAEADAEEPERGVEPAVARAGQRARPKSAAPAPATRKPRPADARRPPRSRSFTPKELPSAHPVRSGTSATPAPRAV